MQPSIDERLRGGFWVFVITQKDMIAPDQDFSIFRDFDLDAGEWLSYRTQLNVVSLVDAGRPGIFGLAIDLPDGKADVILSLELLETLRAVPKCSKRTLAIASTEKMVPLSVSTQKLRYPTVEEVRARFESVARGLVVVDARRLAEESGVPMSSNVVMVGALAGSGTTGLDRKHFERAVEMNIPRRLSENLEAFGKGFETGKSATH
jgi:hypothetical protein